MLLIFVNLSGYAPVLFFYSVYMGLCCTAAWNKRIARNWLTWLIVCGL